MTTKFVANSCRCGHIFETDLYSADYTETESQEEVYEAYLSARLDQARIAAERAIQVLTQNPADRQNIQKADKASRELEKINNEYAKQLSVVEQAREQALKAHMEAHTQNRAAPKPDDYLSAAPLSPEKIVSLSADSVSRDRSNSRSQFGSPAPQSRAVTRARSGRLRQDASEAILARRAAQQLIAQRAEALAQRKPGHNSMPQKMRESTRDRAEIAVQQARNSSSSISGDLAAAANALDPAKPTTMMSRSIIECPSCTARHPITAKQCSCGYHFGTGAESMPGLTLNATDL